MNLDYETTRRFENLALLAHSLGMQSMGRFFEQVSRFWYLPTVDNTKANRIDKSDHQCREKIDFALHAVKEIGRYLRTVT